MAPKRADPELIEAIETLCYLPSPTIEASEIRAQVGEALEDEMTPALLSRNAIRRTVLLPPDMVAALRKLGQAQSPPMSVGKTVGGLLGAVAVRDGKAVATGQNEWAALSLRPEQMRALDQLKPQLLNGRLVLAEVGTGIGKSRIAAVVADFVLKAHADGKLKRLLLSDEDAMGKEYAYAQRGAKRALNVVAARNESDPSGSRQAAVIICQPTIANIVHMAAECEAVRKEGLLKYAVIRVVLGRAQFVSPSRAVMVAQSLLEDSSALRQADKETKLRHQCAIAVIEWVKAGMPPGKIAETKQLLALHKDLSGLMDDLKSIAPDGFPFAEIALTSDDDEVEAECYERSRHDIHDADVILTTHHTVAYDNLALIRGATGILPRALCLIMDEAHLFEGVQSSVTSVGVSLYTLGSELKKVPKASALVADLGEISMSLRRIGEDMGLPADQTTSNGRVWAELQPKLQSLRAGLFALIGCDANGKRDSEAKKKSSRKKVEPAEDRHRRFYIRRAADVLKAITTGSFGHLSFSPDYRYPSLTSGPASVSNYLAGRWAVTDCAVALSGTLLLPSTQGLSPKMMRARLALTPDRAAVITPVHSAWVFSTPTVYMPSMEIAAALTPPQPPFTQEASLKGWLSNVALVIERHIAPSAKGGTLVLVSGFERAEVLAACLSQDTRDRLVLHDRKHQALLAGKRQYEAMYREGRRPIWIATGGAWTGLDLLDKEVASEDAAKDMLLTDLVMVSLPFGMTRSLSHQMRVENRGFVAEKEQMLLTFIQGLGRLVRKPGLTHRRLWVLDGRLKSTTSRICAEALSHLSRYSKHTEIRFD